MRKTIFLSRGYQPLSVRRDHWMATNMLDIKASRRPKASYQGYRRPN